MFARYDRSKKCLNAALLRRSVLPDLEKAGVVGLIEPINPWSLPRYNMDSFEDGLNIVK